MKSNVLTLLFCITLCSSLYVIKKPFKTIPARIEITPEHKSFNTKGSEKPNVIDPPAQKSGHLFDRPVDSMHVCKHVFGSWCPLVENKPKNYGKKICN